MRITADIQHPLLLERCGTESRLSVELHTHGSVTTLVLQGVLCEGSIGALEAHVDQLGSIPCHDVVIDIRGLRVLDQVGANVLLGLYHYVEARGGRLRISGAVGPIAKGLAQLSTALSSSAFDMGERPLLPRRPASSES